MPALVRIVNLNCRPEPRMSRKTRITSAQTCSELVEPSAFFCQSVAVNLPQFDKIPQICYYKPQQRDNLDTLIQRGGGTGPVKPRQPVWRLDI